jgi:D-hexose-6-phosphate mutarotase
MSRHRIVPQLPASVTLVSGGGALPLLRVDSDRHGRAEIYLHGAQLAAWQPPGQPPVIFLSRNSAFDPAKPIRGGVPICFPWFGPHPNDKQAPMHGFARILPWTLSSVDREAGGPMRAVLHLAADAAARGGFPHDLGPSLAVAVGRALRMELTVRNVGSAPATFEQALHSYFAVSDVRQVRIRGLEGVGYVDKTAAMARKPPEESPIGIAAETDRVYAGATGTVTIEDPGWKRRIVVGKTGSSTTVVWNPWVAKAKAMPDFGDDEWTGMVCVETANAMDDAVTLAPGAAHVMAATLGVESA